MVRENLEVEGFAYGTWVECRGRDRGLDEPDELGAFETGYGECRVSLPLAAAVCASDSAVARASAVLILPIRLS